LKFILNKFIFFHYFYQKSVIFIARTHNMEITIIRNESEILNECSYSARPVEGSAGVSSKKSKGNSRRRGIACDTAYDYKPALLPKGSAKPDEQKALALIKSSLLKKDNDVIFLKKRINPEDAFSNEAALFPLNISTEALKDQYAIGKVAFDMSYQRTSKYREAQAYCLLPKPTLEIYA
jgi:hypothetical protein